MLLYLFDFLAQDFSFFNIFQYLTFRAICAVLTSLLVSLLFGGKIIRALNRYQIGQTVRQDGPPTHFEKVGTPTMGGLLILFSVLMSTILWGRSI